MNSSGLVILFCWIRYAQNCLETSYDSAIAMAFLFSTLIANKICLLIFYYKDI